MKLWVRSQDKRILQKVDNIFINANYDNKRICTYDGAESVELGTYKSKERALEILDEIHEHIEKHGKTYLQENGLKYYGNVYEMPEE